MTDFTTAWRSMTAANAAYELDPAKRAELLAIAGLRETAFLEGPNDARGLVAIGPGGLNILAFQGTQFSDGEIPSIEENLKIAPADLGSGRHAEAGYWQQTTDLLPAIAKLLPWQGPLVITGHSMGGCIAELYSAVYWKALPDKTECISFGAPMCANREFWTDALIRPTRFVREDDFAPAWPYLVEWIEQSPDPYWWIKNRQPELRDRGRPGINISVPAHDPSLYLADVARLAGV